MSEPQVSRRDVERLFLQAILSRGVVSEKVAQLLRKKCIDAVNACSDLELPYSDSVDEWNSFVSRLKQSIDKLDFEFTRNIDEYSGRVLYAMVNRKDDPVAQLATDYTPAEISFFKGVVEQIMLAPNESFSVSHLVALREISHLKLNLTKAQGEILLSSFVSKGWLKQDKKKGRYALAFRSISELENYIKTTYPDDFLECTACQEIITHGVGCHTPNCKSRLHHHCFTAYRRRSGTCTNCGVDWPAEAQALRPVGWDAANEEDFSRASRRRVAFSDDEDEEEAEYSGADENEEAPQQTQSKSKGKGKQKKKVVVSDDDDDDDDVNMEDDEPSQSTQKTRRSSRRQ